MHKFFILLVLFSNNLFSKAQSEYINLYDLDFKNPQSEKSKHLTGSQLADLYKSFIKDYPSKTDFLLIIF